MIKMLSGRWIMSVCMTCTLCLMAYQGKVTSEAFLAIVSGVVAYYFGRRRAEEK